MVPLKHTMSTKGCTTLQAVSKSFEVQHEAIRRQVFWLLQRLTSWSLWKAKQQAFKIFADAYELAIKTDPANGAEELDANHLTVIYEILACYDKGLAELGKGRRFVWRAGQPLQRAVRQTNVLGDNFYRNPKYWEHGSQFAPYPEKVNALYQLMRASQFRMDYAPLEVWTDDKIAYLESADSLLNPARYDHGFYELAYPTIPEVLPPVPETSGPVIQSGQAVPYDGIWEPVMIERSRVLGVFSTGPKLFENEGCFNYLIADTEAPNLSDVDDNAFGITPRPTHWRLLWEDTRYKDGAIPDETQYFLKPLGSAHTIEPSAVEPVHTGAICPASGEWRTDEHGGSTVRVMAGDRMPDLLVKDSLGERKVHWVRWRLERRID